MVEGGEGLAGLGIPHPRRLVQTRGGHPRPIGAKAHRPDRVIVVEGGEG